MTARWLTPREDGVRLALHVQPRAGRTAVAGEHGGALKIRLAAPPVDGAANRELVSFLAGRLGVPKSSVRITAGERGRRKTVTVEGVDPGAVRAALDPPG